MRIPETALMFRETLALSPLNMWQYFQILGDRIMEVRCDGQEVWGGEKAPFLPNSRSRRHLLSASYRNRDAMEVRYK
jgi:hypothetical protein